MCPNALTVDLEDWFHICGAGGALAPSNWDALPSRVAANTRTLLDLFDDIGVRATFFTLGWVAERHPGLIADIAARGHEIGAHSFAHQRAYELTSDAFERDLDRNLAALRGAGVAEVRGYRAPEWSINDRSLWALDVLARKGFTFDSSMTPLRIIGNPTFPQVPHVRTTAGGPLVEFPPLVGRRLGQNIPLGGGWGLRLSRPRAVVTEIERRNRLGHQVALFVHPWELDDDPPRMKLGPAARFVHYAGLTGFRGRFAEVLRHVPLAPIGEVLRCGRAAD
jgi:polysaccharide deacetylase family protein (PEP-CTERM system associated)